MLCCSLKLSVQQGSHFFALHISARAPPELFGAAGPAAVLGVLRNTVNCGAEAMPLGVLAVSQDPVWILGPGFFVFFYMDSGVWPYGLSRGIVFPVRQLRHLVDQRTENSGVSPVSGLKWTFLG